MFSQLGMPRILLQHPHQTQQVALPVLFSVLHLVVPPLSGYHYPYHPMLGLRLLTLAVQYCSKVSCACGDMPPPEHVHMEHLLSFLLVMHVYKVIHSTNSSDDLIRTLPLWCQFLSGGW